MEGRCLGVVGVVPLFSLKARVQHFFGGSCLQRCCLETETMIPNYSLAASAKKTGHQCRNEGSPLPGNNSQGNAQTPGKPGKKQDCGGEGAMV